MSNMSSNIWNRYYGPATAADETTVKACLRLQAEYFPHEEAGTLVYHVRNTEPATGKYDVPTLLRWAEQARTGAPFTE